MSCNHCKPALSLGEAMKIEVIKYVLMVENMDNGITTNLLIYANELNLLANFYIHVLDFDSEGNIIQCKASNIF